MRRERFNLEDQVGGLIDHERYELRRRESPPEPTWPAREKPAARGRLSIRAARATTGKTVERHVA